MSDQESKPGLPNPVFVGHRYEQVVAKEFKATIPHHILAKLPEDERFLVETMSKLENQYEWLVTVAIKNNGDIMSLDSRLSAYETVSQQSALVQHAQQTTLEDIGPKVGKLWDWKQFFSGKWAVVVCVALVIGPVILKFLLDLVLKWIKP
jgi:hypothetical protein